MKTSLSLLVALLSPFIAATARAMDISITLTPGYNLVANPLITPDNSIGSLFKNMQGGVPAGTKIFKFVNTNNTYITVTWDDLDNQFIPPSVASETTLPGDGVFVFIPGSESKVLTFSGEIQPLTCFSIPRGYSIKSAPVPEPDLEAFVSFPGCAAFRYNKILRAYDSYWFDDLDFKWIPDPGLPLLPAGEAIFILSAIPRIRCFDGTIIRGPYPIPFGQ